MNHLSNHKNSLSVEESTNQAADKSSIQTMHQLDTTGLICPEPVMMLHQTIRRAESGDTIEVIATDPATTRDIPNFCNHLGHTLISQSTKKDEQIQQALSGTDIIYHYLIQKK